MLRLSVRLASFGVVLLVWATLVSAMAAANTVPTSKAYDKTRAITPNDLKPVECASLNLTALIVGNGNVTGTAANELIIHGAAGKPISGGGGNDCILGGDGDDSIDGGTGTDVCIGGPGADTFTNCETSYQ